MKQVKIVGSRLATAFVAIMLLAFASTNPN